MVFMALSQTACRRQRKRLGAEAEIRLILYVAYTLPELAAVTPPTSIFQSLSLPSCTAHATGNSYAHGQGSQNRVPANDKCFRINA
jgi:hypothetical protein